MASFSWRRLIKGTAAPAAGGLLGVPAIVHGQGEAIRIGHLTPRTGFLGQIGEYGYRGAALAVDEANIAGGVLGRPVQLIAEDSVNPATAVTKAQKLYERDRVLASLGEINSASVAAVAQVAARARRIHFNSGGNSDEVRGKLCNRYLFHVKGNNTMHVRAIGQWLKEAGRIRGAKWYFLVADYAFGHDLYRASSQFLREAGGIEAGRDMIATNTQDFSAYIPVTGRPCGITPWMCRRRGLSRARFVHDSACRRRTAPGPIMSACAFCCRRLQRPAAPTARSWWTISTAARASMC
jgi:branched-chain amino acid transport system substrate-binding protein